VNVSRSHRLFDLMQALRRHRRTVSGQALARELGVSLRTIRRDVATLQGMGADIDAEPGVGYLLHPGFVLPPLSFSEV
jgi:predicted DNA-binding transcriptional regulator YafY